MLLVTVEGSCITADNIGRDTSSSRILRCLQAHDHIIMLCIYCDTLVHAGVVRRRISDVPAW